MKGLKIRSITKHKLHKLVFGERMLMVADEVALRQQMEQALAHKGQIYGFFAQKELVCLFVFDKEKVNLETVYVDAADILKKEREEKTGNAEEQWVYRLVEQVIIPDYENRRGEIEEYLKQDIKERAEFNDCKAILWGEEILQQQSVKVGSMGYVSAIAYGIALGVLFGIALDNIALGICFGVCFASGFGMIWTTRKPGDKKKDASEEIKESE